MEGQERITALISTSGCVLALTPSRAFALVVSVDGTIGLEPIKPAEEGPFVDRDSIRLINGASWKLSALPSQAGDDRS